MTRKTINSQRNYYVKRTLQDLPKFEWKKVRKKVVEILTKLSIVIWRILSLYANEVVGIYH